MNEYVKNLNRIEFVGRCAFHQETIPLEPVKFFAACVKEAGIYIELSPAWLVSENDNNPYNVKTREISVFHRTEMC